MQIETNVKRFALCATAVICLGNTPVKPFIFTAARSVPADILSCPLSPLHLLVIAATYVRFIKRPPTVDCCRRNATRAIPVISEQKDDTPPTPRSMGHVTHVLACRRLPPTMLLLLAFRIAFVLLLLNPANRHPSPPCSLPPPCAHFFSGLPSAPYFAVYVFVF